MIRVIVAVFDRAAETFGTPFDVPHTNVAIRHFTDEANNKDSEIHQHADDYDLYHVGSFDNNNGAIYAPEGAPVRLARAKDLVRKQE